MDGMPYYWYLVTFKFSTILPRASIIIFPKMMVPDPFVLFHKRLQRFLMIVFPLPLGLLINHVRRRNSRVAVLIGFFCESLFGFSIVFPKDPGLFSGFHSVDRFG